MLWPITKHFSLYCGILLKQYDDTNNKLHCVLEGLSTPFYLFASHWYFSLIMFWKLKHLLSLLLVLSVMITGILLVNILYLRPMQFMTLIPVKVRLNKGYFVTLVYIDDLFIHKIGSDLSLFIQVLSLYTPNISEDDHSVLMALLVY